MTNYQYDFMLPVEAATDEPYAYWVKEQAGIWYHRSYAICAAYVAGIYFGQKFMANRAPVGGKWALIAWNVFLSAFSIAGALRFSPDFFTAVSRHGFLHSICVTDYHMTVPGYWTMWFAISKAFELGDTFFLVIRKRPVIFLHWYHHVTVLIYTWHAVSEFTGAGRWFVGMNYLVHGVMYPYYLARSLGVRVPKVVSIGITLLQLLQMFIGCGITATLAYVHWFDAAHLRHASCQISDKNLAMAVLIYSSYLALFLNFFHKAYIAKKDSKKDHHRQKENGTGGDYQKVANGSTLPESTDFANGTLVHQNGDILEKNGSIYHQKSTSSAIPRKRQQQPRQRKE